MRRATQIAIVLTGTMIAGVAIGLPWDVDMADSDAVKAYEQPMRPLPEGVVSQPNLLTPRSFSPNYERGSDEANLLVNPLPNDEATLAAGEKMYGIYCTPCHGDGVTLGPVGDPSADRFPLVPQLAGATGRLKGTNDGWVYTTIRNGGGLMPYYGWAMTDDEMWSIVRYVRTMPNAAYVPPAPPQPDTGDAEAGEEAP